MTHKLLVAPALAVGLLVFALSGCAGAAGSDPSPTPVPAIEQFAELPGVVGVSPYDSWVTVTVGVDASDSEVLEAAASIDSIATEAKWQGAISLERENVAPYDAEMDVSTSAPWTVEVFPAHEGTADTLSQLLVLEQLENITSIAVIEGWPYVEVGAVEGLADTFAILARNPLFAEGGTVHQGDKHLRIVWVPKRTSLHAVDEIIAIAADYPAAEVLLEAPTAGPQWPALYIARLSADEAAALQQRLLDPALADADVEGYEVPFILTSIGPEGPVYLDGNLGGVVEG